MGSHPVPAERLAAEAVRLRATAGFGARLDVDEVVLNTEHLRSNAGYGACGHGPEGTPFLIKRFERQSPYWVQPLWTRLPLVVLQPRGEDGSPWGLAGWLGAIEDSLESVLATVKTEAAGHRRVDSFGLVRSVATLGAFLPLAKSVGALRELQEEYERAHAGSSIDALLEESGAASRGELGDVLVPALLLAGDASLLRDPALEARLARAFDELGFDASGFSGEAEQQAFWSRLLLTSSNAELRELAGAKLQGLPMTAVFARTLMPHVEARNPRLPAWLAERATEADRALWWEENAPSGGTLGFSIFMLLAALGTAALTFARRRTARRRLVPAAVLLLLGLILASMRVPFGRFDLLPDTLAFALATGGALLLARQAKGRARWLTPVGFGLAFVLDPFEESGVPWGLPFLTSTFFAYLGTAGLPALAGSLHRAARDEHRRLPKPETLRPPGAWVRFQLVGFHVVYTLPIGLLSLWGIWAVVTGSTGSLEVAGLVALPLLLMPLFLLLVWIQLWRAARLRARSLAPM